MLHAANIAREDLSMKHYAKILSVLLAITMVFTLAPSVSLAATRNASITSSSLPSTAVVKTKYTVTITVKNTGTENWTSTGGYCLAPVSGNPFTSKSVSLKTGETVKPGKTKIFKFSITAPATAGKYTASWQMTKGSTAFGAKLSKKITVNPLTLTSIYLLRLPTKLTYYRFEKLNIAGLAVMGRYNDDTKKQVGVTAANVTGYNSNYTGTYRLTVCKREKRLLQRHHLAHDPKECQNVQTAKEADLQGGRKAGFHRHVCERYLHQWESEGPLSRKRRCIGFQQLQGRHRADSHAELCGEDCAVQGKYHRQ
jgi:hypothetical protein